MITRLNVMVDILLTCLKHLHNRINSPRVEFWNHEISLTLTLCVLKCLYQGIEVGGQLGVSILLRFLRFLILERFQQCGVGFEGGGGGVSFFFPFSMFLKSTVFFLITFDLIGSVFLFKRVLFLDT